MFWSFLADMDSNNRLFYLLMESYKRDLLAAGDNHLVVDHIVTVYEHEIGKVLRQQHKMSNLVNNSPDDSTSKSVDQPINQSTVRSVSNLKNELAGISVIDNSFDEKLGKWASDDDL